MPNITTDFGDRTVIVTGVARGIGLAVADAFARAGAIAMAAAVERTGRIDVVVNNAGILRDEVLWELDDADGTPRRPGSSGSLRPPPRSSPASECR